MFLVSLKKSVPNPVILRDGKGHFRPKKTLGLDQTPFLYAPLIDESTTYVEDLTGEVESDEFVGTVNGKEVTGAELFKSLQDEAKTWEAHQKKAEKLISEHPNLSSSLALELVIDRTSKADKIAKKVSNRLTRAGDVGAAKDDEVTEAFANNKDPDEITEE